MNLGPGKEFDRIRGIIERIAKITGDGSELGDDCAVIPVEVAGVVGVSALGNLSLKSFYSSYGVGSVSVSAPGGDSILQKTTAARAK